jgi:hypothetical protein
MACTEPRLIELGYAFEQATKRRAAAVIPLIVYDGVMADPIKSSNSSKLNVEAFSCDQTKPKCCDRTRIVGLPQAPS